MIKQSFNKGYVNYCSAFKRNAHSRVFPDDKWVTYNSFLATKDWIHIKYLELDSACKKHNKSTEPKDTDQNYAAKYVSFKMKSGICIALSHIVRFTTSEGYFKYRNIFIDALAARSTAVINYLEKKLAKYDSPERSHPAEKNTKI